MSLAEVTLRQGDEHMKDVPIELIQGLACVFNGNILAASKNLITEILIVSANRFTNNFK